MRKKIQTLSNSISAIESKRTKSSAYRDEIARVELIDKLRKLHLEILDKKFGYWFSSKMLPKYAAGKTMTESEIKKIVNLYNSDFFATTEKEFIEQLIKYVYGNVKAIEAFNKQYFYIKLNSYESKMPSITVDNKNIEKPLA